MATLAKAPRTTYEGNIVSSVSYETLLSVLSDPLMDGELFLVDIEKQIQQLQAQRSNLPKVDIGEKVSMSSRNLYNLHKISTLFNNFVAQLNRKIL